MVDQKFYNPEVNTGSASVLSSDSVNLTGLVNPNDQSAEYYFEYGSTPDLGDVTDKYVVQEESTIVIKVEALDPETIYYYRIVAANSVGTSHGRTASFYNTFSEPKMSQTPDDGGNSSGSGGGCYITAITGSSAAVYGSYPLIILFGVPFSVLAGRFLWNYLKPAV
jgi:phosphodiesterase/alkaline phosphatase D-like protein